VESNATLIDTQYLSKCGGGVVYRCQGAKSTGDDCGALLNVVSLWGDSMNRYPVNDPLYEMVVWWWCVLTPVAKAS